MIGVVASASPELAGPQIACTFWRLISSCVALTALVGSPWVSRATISTLRPLTPPRAVDLLERPCQCRGRSRSRAPPAARSALRASRCGSVRPRRSPDAPGRLRPARRLPTDPAANRRRVIAIVSSNSLVGAGGRITSAMVSLATFANIQGALVRATEPLGVCAQLCPGGLRGHAHNGWALGASRSRAPG